MNPELKLESVSGGTLYIKDETTGDLTPMLEITCGALEVEMVESEGTPIKLMSSMTFETTIQLSDLTRAWLVHPNNNWLRNHGYPARRKRRRKYGQ